MSALAGIGLATSIAGAVSSTIGSYYDALSKKRGLQSQALNEEFAASIADINARAAESDANAILQAGRTSIGQMGLRYAQERASQRASAAGRGVALDEGSTAELGATLEYARESDAYTMSANAIRAANAQRARGVGLRNQAMLGRVSASNMRRMASSIRPWVSAATSFIGGASTVSRDWLQSQRSVELLRQGGA